MYIIQYIVFHNSVFKILLIPHHLRFHNFFKISTRPTCHFQPNVYTTFGFQTRCRICNIKTVVALSKSYCQLREKIVTIVASLVAAHILGAGWSGRCYVHPSGADIGRKAGTRVCGSSCGSFTALAV
jgi:hypothetical protein